MRHYKHDCGYECVLMSKEDETTIAKCPDCEKSPATFKAIGKPTVVVQKLESMPVPVLNRAPVEQNKLPKPQANTKMVMNPAPAPAKA